MENEKDNNEKIIYIGGKPFMNYVTATVMHFTKKESDSVIVSARGKFISRAVDVVEVAIKKFLTSENVKIAGINIDSTDMTNKIGKSVRVSTIDIYLEKMKT